MKQSVNFTDFTKAFYDHDRGTQFTYDGLRALFGYLEDLEDDIGEMELDVISLCCDYTEYEGLYSDLCADYPDIRVMEDLHDNTSVIMIDDVRFIIANY
tara:strand:- start:365 stop:661 length:297 start_codon:yes stop_codon:yes gene_type:complete